MRTVKVRQSITISHEVAIELETEVFIEDDNLAEEAGRDARRVLAAVVQGFADEEVA